MKKRFLTANPYIIAEIGVNHEGNLEMAKKLIKLAKEGGAHAAKFQTYKADSLAVRNSPAYWDKNVNKIRNQHELFTKYDKFDEYEYQSLAAYCKEIGISFASTPFDNHAVDMLYPLMPFYKIASADITNTPLLRKIANKKKPIILSTGASNKKEIASALSILKKNGAKDICLMHCVLNYPTSDLDANLNMITDLKNTFKNVKIGYSDHTQPGSDMLMCITAYLKGAIVIEKHFTNDKSLKGNDHFHAMDIKDLKRFCKSISKIQIAEGKKVKTVLPSEQVARKNARRSIVAHKDLEEGTKLDETNLTCKRPATGISPLFWDKVIGKKLKKSIKADQILKWSDI